MAQDKTAIEIRKAHGLARLRVAARAGVSEPSVRLFEVAPGSLGEKQRNALAKVYADLADTLPEAG